MYKADDVEPTTLTTPYVPPSGWISLMAAMVSMVSPDCDTAKCKASGLTTGSDSGYAGNVSNGGDAGQAFDELLADQRRIEGRATQAA